MTIDEENQAENSTKGGLRMPLWRARKGWLAGIAALVLVTGAVVVGFLARRFENRQAPEALPTSETSVDAAFASSNVHFDSDASSDAGVQPVVPSLTSASVSSVWRLSRLASDSDIELYEGVIGHHSLVQTLISRGVKKQEAYRLMNAFQGVRRFDRCDVKDTFSIAKRKSNGRLVGFEFASSPFDVWQARFIDTDDSTESSGTWIAQKLEFHVERVRTALGVAVEDDLRSSLARVGLDANDDLIQMIDDAFEGHVDLTNVRPGARLKLIVTEARVEGTFARYEQLDAIEYAPSAAGADSLRIYHFGAAPLKTRAKRARLPLSGYFDKDGRQPYRGGWRVPVPLARIASRFNPRRMHPVLHVVMPHNGVDFAAPSGTPVYATAGGTVVHAGDGGPCGNMVQLLHGNGLISAYCHLARFAAGLRLGQHVEGRQLVGYVGQTGRATGPHLHFAIKRGERFLDPLVLKLDGVRVVPREERDVFAQKRAELDSLLDSIPMPPASMRDGDAGSSFGPDFGLEGGEYMGFEDAP